MYLLTYLHISLALSSSYILRLPSFSDSSGLKLHCAAPVSPNTRPPYTQIAKLNTFPLCRLMDILRNPIRRCIIQMGKLANYRDNLYLAVRYK